MPHFFDMKIEKLKKSDVGRVSSLLRELFFGMDKVFPKHALSNFDFENSEDEISRLMGRNNRIYLVAKDGNEIMGVAHGYHYGGVFYLVWLGVKEKFRGSGVGSALLRGLEKRVSKRCHKIYLISAVDLGALKFYEKNGYQCEGLLRKGWWSVDYYSLGKIL